MASTSKFDWLLNPNEIRLDWIQFNVINMVLDCYVFNLIGCSIRMKFDCIELKVIDSILDCYVFGLVRTRCYIWMESNDVVEFDVIFERVGEIIQTKTAFR